MKNRPTVWINRSVCERILIETKRFFPTETGGVLIGYWGNHNEVVITDMIDAGPTAIHEEMSFIPDHEYQLRKIEALYFATERTERYLGDWHSHPNAEPYLSEKDKATLKKIAAYKEARLQKPLMLVIGTNPPEIGIWFHHYKTILNYSSIQKCKMIFF